MDFIEQGTALESMRASDFDCYSAYGEVIDNSIQANANDIRIQFLETRGNTRSKKIESILFADNGQGMSAEILRKCLKLGYSSRYNDRSGIGRFGVGMTLGAIHECRRIEVYSKVAGGNWLYIYMDLDEISGGQQTELPVPELKKPVFDIINYIGESGTLVVWSKNDKQSEGFDTIVRNSDFWIGRTFRKFLWGEAIGFGEVSIMINNKRVTTFDPLFVNKKYTGFEGEAQAELLAPKIYDWDVPSDFINNEIQTSKIIVNISLLPDEYRRSTGQGGDSFAKERKINENEGVSILRNDREVFFGQLGANSAREQTIGSTPADMDLNRFIGCEISFTAELDSVFEVKNIKRGAKPIRELKDRLISDMRPTFNTLRGRIRNRWEETKREGQQQLTNINSEIGVSGGHSITNEFLRNQRNELLRNNRSNNDSNDIKIAKKINPNATSDQIELIVNGLKENGITIDEREFIGDAFIDMEHGNQLKTLFYNTNSTFYKAYSEILDELRNSNQEIAEKYKVLVDLIFVGYMIAESNIDPNEEMKGIQFANDLKSFWSLNMTKILRKWQN